MTTFKDNNSPSKFVIEATSYFRLACKIAEGGGGGSFLPGGGGGGGGGGEYGEGCPRTAYVRYAG